MIIRWFAGCKSNYLTEFILSNENNNLEFWELCTREESERQLTMKNRTIYLKKDRKSRESTDLFFPELKIQALKYIRREISLEDFNNELKNYDTESKIIEWVERQKIRRILR